MVQKVVIAGGGTGGHLYPGISLARALMKHSSDIQISFVGTRQGLEASVLPREGFDLKTIISGGLLGKKGLARWTSWSKLPVGLVESLWFLKKKKPDLVVGVGGYASGPLVLSAWALRIPILIHEQNSIPGITNKWLAKIADKVAISFKSSERFFPAGKTVETGNMIREEFCQLTAAPEASREGPFCVLVLGGSQGAHSINMAMIEALDFLADEKDALHFIHQTGKRDAKKVRASYAAKGFSADVQPFIKDMADQYHKASLVICRAGASTLAEVTACGKVSLLVPYPFAAHNHQEKNARVLEGADASEVILDPEVNGRNLAEAIRRSMKDPERMEQMGQNSFNLGQRDATEKVKQICLDLMTASRA